MQIESLPISSLIPDQANARKHGARNLKAIASSLRRFGQQKPIVIDSKNVVRAGNGTLEAATTLGWTHISVVRSELPLTELKAFAVVDNRTAELAEWDTAVLADLHSEIPLDDLGFDPTEIAKLLHVSDIEPPSVEIEQAYQVVIECPDESSQRELYERLRDEGLTCRLLTI